MQLGIFAKTFPRPTLEQTLDAVAAHGLSHVQFNLSCAGLPTLPDEVPPALCERIARAHETRGLTMAAVSGTFNMIDPDLKKRAEGLRRLEVLAAACRPMGTSIITLCTGSRDPESMWQSHPDNISRAAWDDLVASMRQALSVAARHGVTLGVEPEVSNVIDSACKARRLIDALGGRRQALGVVMDAANVFHTGELPRMREILTEAFELLGDETILAHAKDLAHDGAAGEIPAGSGKLDYDLYLGLLHAHGYRGPLILHGLNESQVPDCVAFLKVKLAGLEHIPSP